MLRITIEDSSDSATIRLEGDLAGQWVEEVERCWQSILAGPEKRTLRIALDTVTYVDAAGKALLREMHSAGAQLEAKGALSSYLVEQIRQRRAG
jgi:ABC-type transporter Mla MlaB component